MGLHSADIASFAKTLLPLDSVTGVWTFTPSEREITIWVTVRGFDDEAALRRETVYQTVETFIDENRDQMGSDFVFDYYVLVDDIELGAPQIPEIAQQVAA